MDLDTAPPAVQGGTECPNCDTGTYVFYEGDKLCNVCGFLPEQSAEPDERVHPWFKWRKIRNTKYELDQDVRRRVVGSYVHAYTDDSGQITLG